MTEKLRTGIFVSLASLLFGLTPAQAYVDPGSGGAFVTAILGFFAAIGYTFRQQFYKLKKLLKNKPQK